MRNEIGFPVAVSILFFDTTGFTEFGAGNFTTAVYLMVRGTRYSMCTCFVAVWQAAGHAFDSS